LTTHVLSRVPRARSYRAHLTVTHAPEADHAEHDEIAVAL
jgi:hypothetical protein